MSIGTTAPGASTGKSQSPWSNRKNSRSARKQRWVGAWSTTDAIAVFSARVCSAITPCPPDGTNCCGDNTSAKNSWPSNSNVGPDKESRSSPARARMIASQSLAANLRNRVGTFPRRSTNLTSDLRQRACRRRRTLLVAMVAAGGSDSSRIGDLVINRSSTGPRGRTAAIAEPGRSSLGKSFALCTARSTRRSMSALSSSDVNRPLRPARGSLDTIDSSPLVRTISILTAISPATRKTFAARSAWISASALPRVPRTSSCRKTSPPELSALTPGRYSAFPL